MKKHQIVLTTILVIFTISLIAILSEEGCSDILSDTVSDNGGSYEQSQYSMSMDIKRSIQDEFDKDDHYSSYEIKVQKVNLIEVGLNSYKAYVDITYLDGKEYLISADVHVSDEQYYWEFPAGTFLFLLDEEEGDFGFNQYRRPTEKELLQMLRDGNFEEASRWLTIEEIFQRAILLDIADGIPKHVKKEQESSDGLFIDEDGDSDSDYYAAIESLRNDHMAYSFEANEDLILSIPKEINTVKIAYPTKYTNDSEMIFKLYVDLDGTVMNVNLISTFKAFSESNELPQEHINCAKSALLNTIFEAGTPNQFNVTYSHYSPRPNQL
jgi:hypothetical protein